MSKCQSVKIKFRGSEEEEKENLFIIYNIYNYIYII